MPSIDPFGGAKPRLLRRGKEAPLRVNPEQAPAFRPGSRRVDVNPPLPPFTKGGLGGICSVFCLAAALPRCTTNDQILEILLRFLCSFLSTCLDHLNFGHSNLFRISDFVLRNWSRLRRAVHLTFETVDEALLMAGADDVPGNYPWKFTRSQEGVCI